jgi:hypothetical protein
VQFNRVRVEGPIRELEVRIGSVEVERKFAMLLREGDLILEECGREFEPHEEVKVVSGYREPEENAPTERVRVIRVERVEFLG